MTTNDLVLPKEFALLLLRKLADDDAFRALYSRDAAQALLSIGVPREIVDKLPPGYRNIRLGSKLIFQEALYQVIDDEAQICYCQRPPTVKLAFGESTGKTTPFEES